jgi:hypothetical protein
MGRDGNVGKTNLITQVSSWRGSPVASPVGGNEAFGNRGGLQAEVGLF